MASLRLGKSFNRSYSIRVPLIDQIFDIGIFFSTKSVFVLFSIDLEPSSSFPKPVEKAAGYKILTFKNLRSSLFCELFLDLYTYSSLKLDIVNQVKGIKDGYHNEVIRRKFEKIYLNSYEFESEGKMLDDKIEISLYNLVSFHKEFIFLVCERCFVSKLLGKKIVRTSALQIGSSSSLTYLKELKGRQQHG
jgi:hypothetical protein